MDTLQDVFRGSSSKEVDFIQYSIYLPPKENHVEYLKDTLDMIHSHIQPLIKDYIWQKDRFHLSIAYDQDQDPSYPFLFGISRFGDCVNDEWFIVYLLKTISVHIPEAVISLVDNDGDVLLIEAALELPSWLDPSNSENRVYLHQGKVHIIPLPTSPADILQIPSSGQLLRSKAIQLVRQQHTISLATSSIQQSIQTRIKDYPEVSKNELHRATCLLPNKAAFVLLSEPQLITLAIEAFYLRDPISLKACASMKIFSPLEGTVETTIQFTKTTYAQTVSQKFYAPKSFRLPSIHQKKQFKFAELGMKVACGLEMLYTSSIDESTKITTVQEYDFENDKKFTAYITHLTKLGYFRSERKGSELYKLLENQAKEQYLQYKKEEETTEKRYVSLNDVDVDDTDTFQGSCDVLSNGSNVKQRIDTLLSQYSEGELEKLLKSSTQSEDSDDWMNVDPQQLEELLMKRMGGMNQSMMNDLEKDFSQENGMDLEAIMSNLENFVENSKSGVDGVEFPKDLSEEEEDSDYEEDDEYEGAIKFDMDKFMSILKGTSHLQKEEDLSQVMEEMDQEIYSYDKLSNSFAKMPTSDNLDDSDVEEDESAPVDVQLNLVKNVLESFKSQQGLPGPVGNILNQFGFVLPGDNEKEE